MSIVGKFAAAGILAIAASSSQAVIPDFGYTMDLNWVTTSGNEPTFSRSNNLLSRTEYDQNVIRWGNYYGDYRNVNSRPDRSQSALEITQSHVTGTIQTNGDSVAANMFTHYNSALNGEYATLQTAQLAVTIQLFAPDVGRVQNITTVFDVHFVETPNTGGRCAWGACDNDIFAILAVDPKLNDLTRSFTYDGQEYVLNYFETTNMLNPLSSAACSRAGVNGACYGFATRENAVTNVRFALSVTADSSVTIPAVPEPETYAMLLAGMGLMGAVIRRRKI